MFSVLNLYMYLKGTGNVPFQKISYSIPTPRKVFGNSVGRGSQKQIF